MKGIRRRLTGLALLLIFSVAVNLYLHSGAEAVRHYITVFFLPIQRFKSDLLNFTGISFGDYLYLFLAFILLSRLIRLVYFGITFLRNKIDFFKEAISIANACLVIYLIFLISWGGNYYRPNLAEQWGRNVEATWDTESLIRLNRFLVGRLNQLSNIPMQFPKLKELNQKADILYHQDFGDCLPKLKVKVTTIGYMLNYAGVHGYYNPLTGEGQFNHQLPAFMHPFVVTHEMAHQAGIGAEDDANLLAYLVDVRSADPAFQYSGYFNIFLYAYTNLQEKDSLISRQIWQSLNPKSKDDYIALKNLYRRYKSFMRGISNDIYDNYLKWNGQQKGLGSYDMVVRWVYYWEFIAKEKADISICPPGRH
ncbi:MAG TPA: DUF3810 domain-containing protein [Edaphocola sp.]|nr:DUF3810 domain-containing protein [Edaphocola sp.]